MFSPFEVEAKLVMWPFRHIAEDRPHMVGCRSWWGISEEVSHCKGEERTIGSPVIT